MKIAEILDSRNVGQLVWAKETEDEAGGIPLEYLVFFRQFARELEQAEADLLLLPLISRLFGRRRGHRARQARRTAVYVAVHDLYVMTANRMGYLNVSAAPRRLLTEEETDALFAYADGQPRGETRMGRRGLYNASGIREILNTLCLISRPIGEKHDAPLLKPHYRVSSAVDLYFEIKPPPEDDAWFKKRTIRLLYELLEL